MSFVAGAGATALFRAASMRANMVCRFSAIDMADVLSIAKLARAASYLNAGLSLVLMSDDDHDVLAAAAHLPPQTLIIVRARDGRRRGALARELVARRHIVLIAGDGELARACGAAGLHLPQARAKEAPHWRALRPRWIVTAAAHSARAVIRAQSLRLDGLFLSPVFLTQSHPERRALGVVRAALIAAPSRIPVYALGGIDAGNAARLSRTHFSGIAATRALLRD
jgi:thiamine-phosphate pyrophosphorylase